MSIDPNGGLMPEIPQVPARNPRSTKVVFAVIAAGAVLLIAGVAVVLYATREPIKAAAQEAFQSPLLTAKATCAPSSVYAQVGDGGDTLTVQTEGEEDDGITYAQLGCFWKELKVTDAVKSEMEATRALDGRQAGDWGDYHASWSYHPDSGFSMVVTIK
jgi:hypothetical protein